MAATPRTVSIRTSDLDLKAAPVDTDLFMIVDVEDPTMSISGTNKKSKFSDVASAIANLLGLGTAATKAVSAPALPAVASVAGPFVAGHVAVFTDPAGTIGDGGAGLPAAAVPVPPSDVFAGPVVGMPAVPTFRPLDPADIPPIPESSVVGLVDDLTALEAGVGAAAVDSAVLHKAADLADVDDPAAARANLGLDTAATRAATAPALAALASVAAPVVVGHLAVFTDLAGTVGDGGPAPPAAAPVPPRDVYAGPLAAPAALPGFRPLDPADIPTIPESGVAGLVDDLTTLETGLSNAAADSAVLHKSSNLADVPDPAAARGSLGLDTAATRAATAAALAAVASVHSPVVVGHLAVFADVAGSLADGGPAPATGGTAPANEVLAGPTTGGPAAPTFRPLAAADIPPIPEAGVIGLVSDLNAINSALGNAAVDSTVLHKSANLADVPAPATARGNLGLGTAATKAATAAGAAALASVNSAVVVGHVAVYTDTAGTIGDGGALPGAAVAEPANAVYAGPTSGAAAVPTFRPLAPADIPAIPASGVTGLGTAATKTATGAGAAVASVGSGPFTVGHLAVYVDAAGTIGDGGPVPVVPAVPLPAGPTGAVQFNGGGSAFGAIAGVVTASGVLLKLTTQAPGDIPLQLWGTAGQTAILQSWGMGATAAVWMDPRGRPIFNQSTATRATVAVGPAAGTGATATIVGNELAGTITLNTGTAPAATAIVFTVTFANPLASPPCSITMDRVNNYAATLPINNCYAFVDWSSVTAAGFRVTLVGGGTLTASVPYIFCYRVNA